MTEHDTLVFRDDRLVLRYKFKNDRYLTLSIDGFGFEDWYPSKPDNELLMSLKAEFQKIAEKVLEMQK